MTLRNPICPGHSPFYDPITDRSLARRAEARGVLGPIYG